MLREELVPAGHRHSTCGFEESEGDAHPLTPQALTPGPWGNLRLPIGSLAVYMSLYENPNSRRADALALH